MDNEFASFFNKPFSGLTSYLALKRDESESLDDFLNGSQLGNSASETKHSQQSTIANANPAALSPSSTTALYEWEMYATMADPSQESNRRWELYMQRAMAGDISIGKLLDRIKATDVSESRMLYSAEQSGQIPDYLIADYNAKLLTERRELKLLLENPPKNNKNAEGLLAKYKRYRKGTIWTSDVFIHLPVFLNRSAVRAQYEKLKRNEADTLDDFLSNPSDRTTDEKEEEEEEKRAETEKEEEARNSERRQWEEMEKKRLENQRSKDKKNQKNLEEQKRRSKLKERLKQ